MRVISTAPMRIDLAGGTLDIYPLYVFEGGAYTINAAIGLRSYVSLETRKDSRIIIKSKDQDLETSAKDLRSLKPEGPLDLVIRLLKYYRPSFGLNVITENNVPKGSGLGASSSLLIALSHALVTISGDQPSKEEIIHAGANIEAQSLRIPTGKQDYYPATYGGINIIHFGLEGAKASVLKVSREFISHMERRTVLSFVGEPRFSGATNWEMMKAYIDGRKETVTCLRHIKQTAQKMKKCLENAELDDLIQLLREEWVNRRRLAEGVSNPQIDEMIEALEAEGAMASKLCGAGGGGCMITFTRDGAKAKVENCLKRAGTTVLPFKLEPRGVVTLIEE